MKPDGKERLSRNAWKGGRRAELRALTKMVNAEVRAARYLLAKCREVLAVRNLVRTKQATTAAWFQRRLRLAAHLPVVASFQKLPRGCQGKVASGMRRDGEGTPWHFAWRVRRGEGYGSFPVSMGCCLLPYAVALCGGAATGRVAISKPPACAPVATGKPGYQGRYRGTNRGTNHQVIFKCSTKSITWVIRWNPLTPTRYTDKGR